jgi:hypothetical protein
VKTARISWKSLALARSHPFQKGGVIRCKFVFSGKNDELTPDFPLEQIGALTKLGYEVGQRHPGECIRLALTDLVDSGITIDNSDRLFNIIEAQFKSQQIEIYE